ncbi:SNARE-binding exocyst subunit S6 [Recurvomyces mirabilis]|nr:SNARE-binding exocyst subunit S6 [Recurvomyces mirabilis]
MSSTLPLPLPPPHAPLSTLLKSPDDLQNLLSLKTDLLRKKSAVDTHLKTSLSTQLLTTTSGMTLLQTSTKTVQAIKEEMQKIDRLCAEQQAMIRDFPEINRMSVLQRNFGAVEGMRGHVVGFRERLEEVEGGLREDEGDLEVQEHLLVVHEGLSALREVREEAMEQVRGSDGAEGESGMELIENLVVDPETGATLGEYFRRLEEVVGWFDEHVFSACGNLIALVQAGCNGLVVRLGLVIEEEEGRDRRVKALREAQKEFGGVAKRFASMRAQQREVRGYKDRLLQAVKASAEVQFEGTKAAFDEDPDRLEKSCRWFFNDLNTVKLGLVDLLPRKWKIFRTYTRVYHQLMHDFLLQRLDDPQLTPAHMLAILNWVPKYYEKVRRLGVDTDSLVPSVIDDREPELVREYRSLIMKAVEEWMDRMARADSRSFSARDETSLDQDAEGYLHTKSLGDMWTMLREQLAVAQASGRADVVEGVVDAMIRALKLRQKMWEGLVDAEFKKISEQASVPGSAPSEIEGLSAYQDWLVAIANDQITNIDDDPAAEIPTTSFLTRFKSDFEPLVSPSYPVTIAPELESLTNAYIDLASHCMHLFASLLFTTDFRTVVRTGFFTPAWYAAAGTQGAMKQITTTFDDYLQGENPVSLVLHPSLREILLEELSDALLLSYLSAPLLRPPPPGGIKFRRQDPFTDLIRQDILTVFAFFQTYPDTFPLVKDKWRAVNAFESLISAPKVAEGGGSGVVEAFVGVKQGWWDVQLGWVEAVLRCRDDFERGMVSGVKGAAGGVEVERGVETVLGRVR